jgi:hypothetical protein
MGWKRWKVWISNNKKLLACEAISMRFEIEMERDMGKVRGEKKE